MRNYFVRQFTAISLMAAMSVLCTSYSYAMPAAPHYVDLQQPDGTTFSARQWGDEHSHGWETDAGHSIVFDQPGKQWLYAVRNSEGHLVGSSIAVQKSVSPPADIQKHLRPLKVSPLRMSGSASSSSALSAPQLAAPVTGTRSLPVILIGFLGSPFTKTKAEFDNLLFGSTGNTMKNYYLQNSYNQLTVNGGASGVYGPVTSNSARTIYGANDASGNDVSPGTLVYEAVTKAAAGGFKFAPFVDQTKSCYVDVVVIVHQGTGEEAGFDVNDIWSHSWDLNSAYSYGNSSNREYVTTEPCSYPGGGGYIKVNKYVIQPELATPDGRLIGVGVFAHEYGHAIGLPDLYDTVLPSSEGAGNWSIMAGGSWLGPIVTYGGKSRTFGDVPSHLDPWSKYYLGWITPTNISGNNTGMPVAAASSAAPNFYSFGTGTPTTGEYFLVENRQKTGFDSYLDGVGLLVWHIDGATISYRLAGNEVNGYPCTSSAPGACPSYTAHYGVSLLQADNLLHLENGTNRGDANDPFVSPKTLTGVTSPNNRLWSGIASGMNISSISSSAATMTVNFSKEQIAQTITVTTPAPATAVNNSKFTVAATASSGLPVTYSSGSIAICTNSGATFTMAAGTGTCVVQYDQAGNTSYSAAPQVTSNTTAAKSPQTITVTTPAPASAAKNSQFTVAATAPGGAVTYGSGSPGVCTSSGATFTMIASSGTCVVQYNQGGNADYNAATQVTSNTVAIKISQTVTVTTPAPASAAYNSQFTVAATASSGLPVTYGSGSPGVCTVTGDTFTMISGTGTCIVQYNQAGNADYNPAAQVTGNTAATKISQTITVTTTAPASAAYNSQFTVAATASSGLTVAYGSGSPTVCSASGATFTMLSGTGTCIVQYNQTGNSSYSAAPQVTGNTNALKISQTISVNTPAPAAAYLDQFTVAATASSGLPVTYSSGSVDVCTGIGATFSMIGPIGRCIVRYDQAGNANYFAAPQQTTSTDRPVTVFTIPVSSNSLVIPAGYETADTAAVAEWCIVQGTSSASCSWKTYPPTPATAFSFTLPAGAADGTYTLSAFARNAVGTVSQQPVTRLVMLDTTPPAISVTPTNIITRHDSVYLSGTCEAGSVVTVKGGLSVPVTANCVNTRWGISFTGLHEGANLLQITGSDALGNQASKVIRVDRRH